MKRYKLSDKAITLLVSPRTGKIAKKDIGLLLGLSPQAINAWIRWNELDGPLTRESILQILELRLDMPRNDILYGITVCNLNNHEFKG